MIHLHCDTYKGHTFFSIYKKIGGELYFNTLDKGVPGWHKVGIKHKDYIILGYE